MCRVTNPVACFQNITINSHAHNMFQTCQGIVNAAAAFKRIEVELLYMVSKELLYIRSIICKLLSMVSVCAASFHHVFFTSSIIRIIILLLSVGVCAASLRHVLFSTSFRCQKVSFFAAFNHFRSYCRSGIIQVVSQRI